MRLHRFPGAFASVPGRVWLLVLGLVAGSSLFVIDVRLGAWVVCVVLVASFAAWPSAPESPEVLFDFRHYTAAHPDLVRHGRVYCEHCGGSSIWMKRISTDVFAHTCHICGNELYYSQTRLPRAVPD